jgi:23S rRNA pseudouridine955/2504/2580 synthase
VLGQWPSNKKVLDKPLEKYLIAGSGEGEGERRVRVVGRDHPDGMPSLSLVKVRASSGALAVPGQSGEQAGSGYSLLEVTIKTGRTHQIRVHLASEGMPIAGDDKYGDFEVNKALARMMPTPLKRMFLHAWRLQCTHPGNGESMELRAVLPLDLSQFLQFAMPEKAAPT